MTMASSENGNKENSTKARGMSFKQKDISNFIDTHIREIKYTLYGIGALSIAYMLRRIYATKIITSAADVPREFITKGVKLQGRVMAIGSGGVLYIKHIPLINLRLSRWSSNSSEKTVPVSIAMVDMTPYGSKWLQDNVDQQHVWFRILAVNNQKPTAQNQMSFSNQNLMDEEKSTGSRKSEDTATANNQKPATFTENQTSFDDHIKSMDEVIVTEKQKSSDSMEIHMLTSAEIFLKKKWRIRDVCVNKELIALGLCKIDHPRDSELVHLSSYESQLLQQLVTIQKEAARKRKGLWKSKDIESDHSGVKKVTSGVLRYSAKVLMFPFHLIGKLWKNKKKT